MTNTAECGNPTAGPLPVSRTRATASLHTHYRKPLLYTGVSLKKIITSLRPLREFTGRVGGQDITFDPEVTGPARLIAAALLPDRFPGH